MHVIESETNTSHSFSYKGFGIAPMVSFFTYHFTYSIPFYELDRLPPRCYQGWNPLVANCKIEMFRTRLLYLNVPVSADNCWIPQNMHLQPNWQFPYVPWKPILCDCGLSVILFPKHRSNVFSKNAKPVFKNQVLHLLGTALTHESPCDAKKAGIWSVLQCKPKWPWRIASG